MGEVVEDAQKNPNVSILTTEQQEKLRQFKIQTRINNETYLRAHPEVDEIIGDFLRHLLVKKPSDIREFAADHFSSLSDPSNSVSKERNGQQ
ncbi:RIIa domain-containing protein 1 [Poecilia reticulata]|uniref:RIIa domain-containing protein 1 n=1 Tax=Poecilia reticulata TaxID=8081 RepID=UPI0004A22324|nr:PREDICTED: RIIa domain-containing protein 1 [Poecilia reticulata]